MAVTARSFVDEFDDAVPRLQDLRLTPVADGLDALRDRLVQSLAAPWSDPGVDDAAEQARPELWSWFQLERAATPGLDAVRIVLRRMDADGELKLTNLLPARGNGRIEREAYNRVVRDFRDAVVRPLEREGVVRAQLSDDAESFAAWVGEEGLRALVHFSLIANKSTGAAHPRDEERWIDFLLHALPARRPGFAEALEQVLVRNGWSEDAASELAIAAERIEAYERRRRERAR